MANKEQIEILKSGPEVWNEWREKNTTINPDLNWAELNREILTGANLSGANLRGASLTEVDLSNAILYRADFCEALLQRADLRGADLRGATFRGTILNGADLRGAILNGADLRGVNLNAANLRETEIRGANLRGAFLNGANLFKGVLTNSILSGAEVNGAILREAKLTKAELHRTFLSGANLYRADLSQADLHGAFFIGADLREAILIEADLSETNFTEADLSRATLRRANLSGARLIGARLYKSDLTNAILVNANLCRASLVKTILQGSDISNSNVYGISVWDPKTDDQTKQQSIVITDEGEPVITVDDLEVAQFIYLMLNNKKIRNVMDAIGKKGVLIIGRFTEERIKILHSIRDELRSRYDLLPIMFEFNPLLSEPTLRTLSTLAHLSRFVIADLTDAKSVLQELTTILKDLPTLPVKPIIHESEELPPMGDSFLIMQSMLKPYVYSTQEKLLGDLKNEVINPAEGCIERFEAQLADIRQKWFPWQKK